MKFVLPPLPYELASLEPIISSQTLSFHHSKHHQAYINNLNSLLDQKGLSYNSLEEAIEKTRGTNEVALFNNAAQSWNHSFFWQSMSPTGGGKPKGMLLEQLEKDFKNYDAFKNLFIEAALSQFGSGWGWLVWDHHQQSLSVIKTGNADLPFFGHQTALVVVDVWEHAYYLDYQNRRLDYLNAFIDKLLNWEFAEQNFAIAKG